MSAVGSLIDALAEDCELQLPAPARSGLLSYLELLARWSARTDLTGAKDPRAQVEVSCLDAFHLVRTGFVGPAARVVDVGAGAGAPSIPLALIYPELRVCLVEPRRRRVAFLRSCIGSLGLVDRVTLHEGRIDLERPRLAGMPFQCAWSRATFEPAVWISLGLRLAWQAVAFVGASGVAECERAARGHGFVAARHCYTVPASGLERAIISVGGVVHPDVPEPG